MTSSLPFPSFTKVWHNSLYPDIDPSQNPSISATGKRIVISGGGSGIGPEIVRAFASAGASQIAIFGRTEGTLRQTRDNIQHEYPETKILPFVADMTDEDSISRLAEAIKGELGSWDVLVANAGYSPDLSNFLDTSTANWFRAFEVRSYSTLPYICNCKF
jgi:NAD(P)-dependent dehydrogenase (short-subunit alcohol dehydrogenase family)